MSSIPGLPPGFTSSSSAASRADLFGTIGDQDISVSTGIDTPQVLLIAAAAVAVALLVRELV